MIDLLVVFRKLPLPVSNGVFSGVSIVGTPHHVAKDLSGNPAVLLTVTKTEAIARPPSLLLKHLRVEHGLRCRISQCDGEIIEEYFSLVQCQSNDPLLHECFLELIEVIIESLPANPTAETIALAMDRMAVLFQAIDRPPTRAAQGLWGELFLIFRSANPRLMAESWHAEAIEHFDFAADQLRLEVKTSASRSRCHHFSFAQTHPPDGVQVVIASMFVERATRGLSIGDLWDKLRLALSANPNLRLKIDEICLTTLGTTWQRARCLAFDENLASDSLEFFDVRDIPSLPSPLPEGISDVRYHSDLSHGQTIEIAQRPTAPLVDLLIRG